jgi:hypothetical protein
MLSLPVEQQQQLAARLVLPVWQPVSLTRWPIFLPAGLLLLQVLVLSACLWSDSQSSQLVLARLLNPQQAIPWPRLNELQLFDVRGRVLSPLSPLPVDARQPLTLYVRDRNSRPPQQLNWEIRGPDGRVQQFQTDRLEADANYDFRLTWLPPRGRSWVRIAGGSDQSHHWCPLETRLPPEIIELSADLEYPEYLRLPPRNLSVLPARLTVPSGTVLKITGRVDRPVVSARIWQRASAAPQVLPFSGDGQSFSWTTTAAEASRQMFWFEVMDAQGLIPGRPTRHELTAQPDHLPILRFLHPIEEISVTPVAQLPVLMQATDEHGLQGLELLLRSPSGQQVLRQQEWTENLPQEIEWELLLEFNQILGQLGAEGAESQAGEVELLARARDAVPHEERWGASPVIRIRIVSITEKLRELNQRAQQQLAAFAQLVDEWERLQEQLPWQKARFEQSGSSGPLQRSPQQELERLLQESQRLFEHPAGLASQLQQLLKDGEQNRCPAESFSEPLSSSLSQLQRLVAEEYRQLRAQGAILSKSSALPGLWQPAADAQEVRTLRIQVNFGLALEAFLHAAREAQAGMTLWKEQQARSMSIVETGQRLQELQAEARLLVPRTIATSLEDLAEEDRLRLQELAEQHRNLSASLQDTAAAEAGLARLVASNDPGSSQRDVLLAAQEIQQAAEQLLQNRLGDALQHQQRALEALHRAAEGNAHQLAGGPGEIAFTTRGFELLDGARSRWQKLRDQLGEAPDTLSDLRQPAGIAWLVELSELQLQLQELERGAQLGGHSSLEHELETALKHLQNSRERLFSTELPGAQIELEQAGTALDAAARELLQLQQAASARHRQGAWLALHQRLGNLSRIYQNAADQLAQLHQQRQTEAVSIREGLRQLAETIRQLEQQKEVWQQLRGETALPDRFVKILQQAERSSQQGLELLRLRQQTGVAQYRLRQTQHALEICQAGLQTLSGAGVFPEQAADGQAPNLPDLELLLIALVQEELARQTEFLLQQSEFLVSTQRELLDEVAQQQAEVALWLQELFLP